MSLATILRQVTIRLGDAARKVWTRLLRTDRSAAWLVFFFSATMAGAVHLQAKHALINDEAYELMITEGVQFERVYFLSPNNSYPRGSVAPIEMGPLYTHRFLFWLFRDWFQTRDNFLIPIHALSVLVLAAACVAFFNALRGYVSRPQSLAAAMALGFSYTPLLFNEFVSRNTVTIIWGCLLMIFIPRVLDAGKETTAQSLKTALICVGLTLAGAWTFTTYLLAAVAVWGGLGFAWLRFKRDWVTMGWIAASGAGFALILLVFYSTDTVPLRDILFRGGYAVNEARAYVQNAGWSLLSPIIYRASGHFFTEDVHVIFGRPSLAAPLAPFYVLGFFAAWRSRNPALFAGVVTWTIGALLCALSGPNQKYLYTFFPLVLLLALVGVRLAHDVVLNRIGRRTAFGFVTVLAILSVGQDMRDLRNQPIDIAREIVNLLPRKVAEQSLESARSGVDTYVQVGIGFDILNWYLWPADLGEKIKRCPVTEGLPDLFLESPPSPGAVLFVDYPPETIPVTLRGWTPPDDVSVKYVEREP